MSEAFSNHVSPLCLSKCVVMQMQTDQNVSRIGVVPLACKKRVDALFIGSAKPKRRGRPARRSSTGKRGSQCEVQAKGLLADVVVVDDSSEEDDINKLFRQPRKEASKGGGELAASKVEEASDTRCLDRQKPLPSLLEKGRNVHKFGKPDEQVEAAAELSQKLSDVSQAKNAANRPSCGKKRDGSLLPQPSHVLPANNAAKTASSGKKTDGSLSLQSAPILPAKNAARSLPIAKDMDTLPCGKKMDGCDKRQEEMGDRKGGKGQRTRSHSKGTMERGSDVVVEKPPKDSISEQEHCGKVLAGGAQLKLQLEGSNQDVLSTKSNKEKREAGLVPADANVKAAHHRTASAVAWRQKAGPPFPELEPAKDKTKQDIGLPVFPGFTIESKVEAGGYSTVYKVVSDGKIFALKCLKENSKSFQVSTERDMLQRFGGKDCIIKCLDFVRNEKGEQAFVFDYVEHDKTEVLKRAASVKDVQCYMRDLFTALAAMHKQGVAHRDVKPANFLYCRRLKRGLLVDLGLAQVQAHSPAMEGTTRLPVKLAPPAPESQSCLSELTRTSPGGSQSAGRDAVSEAVVSKKRAHDPGATAEEAMTKKRRISTFSGSASSVAGGHGHSRKAEGATRASQQSAPCSINKSSWRNFKLQRPVGAKDRGGDGPSISEGRHGGEKSLVDEVHKSYGMSAPGRPRQGLEKQREIASGLRSGPGTTGHSKKHGHLERGFSTEAGLMRVVHTTESASAAHGEIVKESRRNLATVSWGRRVSGQANSEKRTSVPGVQLANCKEPSKSSGKQEEKLPAALPSSTLAVAPLRGSRGAMMMMAAQMSLGEGGHSALKGFPSKSPNVPRNERGYVVEGKQKLETMKPNQGKMQTVVAGQMQKVPGPSGRAGSIHKVLEDISGIKNAGRGMTGAGKGGDAPAKMDLRKLVREDGKHGHASSLKFHPNEKQPALGVTTKVPFREALRQKSLQQPKHGRQGGNYGIYGDGPVAGGVRPPREKGSSAAKLMKQKFLVRKFRGNRCFSLLLFRSFLIVLSWVNISS
ncbi:hypothetical protein CBR_g3704 [Chara braunii]|uniref:non-specific serine/threonine protein kinase n=1 Tax=Chara braunii TaxID=69332 RepID=A0A388KG30_CHABU|nr:hypothetical protein CBR_g3704 [Chara braunii]|eukprot:GBG69005.1 hypothetical protein CBR_g3704 [Chara braunii]